MPNKTIYITNEDMPIWKKAKRHLVIVHEKSISAYLTECLKNLLESESK